MADEANTPPAEETITPEVGVQSLTQEELVRRANITFELEALQETKEKLKREYDIKIEEAKKPVREEYEAKMNAIIAKMAELEKEKEGLSVKITM